MSDGVAAKIYRKTARYMLQLFKLDFPRIDSLSKSSADMWRRKIRNPSHGERAHDVLVLGGESMLTVRLIIDSRRCITWYWYCAAELSGPLNYIVTVTRYYGSRRSTRLKQKRR
jgi:hypothetical protein